MKPNLLLHAFIVALLILAAWFMGHNYERIPSHNLSRPLSLMPMVLGSFKGTSLVVEDYVADVLKPSDVMYRLYSDAAGRMVTIFVSYHGKQRSESQPHSPLLCFPSSGYEEIERSSEKIRISADLTVKYASAIYKKENNKTLVIYWYQTGGRYMNSWLGKKISTIIDGVLKRRADIAYVVVSTKIKENEEVNSKNFLLDFVRILAPELNKIFVE